MDKYKQNRANRTDADRYHDMSELSQSGWWEYDQKTKFFTFSDFVKDVLCLNCGSISYDECLNLVNAGYRTLFKEYINYLDHDIIDARYHRFLIKTPNGDVWVKTKRMSNPKDSAKGYAFGILTLIHKQEKTSNVSQTEDILIYKDKLIRQMPIGYTRIRGIRNVNTGLLENYIIVEVNKHSSYLYNKHGEEEGKLGSEIHNSNLFKKNINYLNKVLKNKEYIAQRITTPSGIVCRKIAYKSGKDEIVEFNVDLSETIDAMEAAKRSNELFRNVFMNIPIGVSLYDTKGRITDMNNSFMEIYGINSKKDVKGYSFIYDINMTDEIRCLIEKEENTVFTVNYDFDKIDNYITQRHDKAVINCKVVHLYHDHQHIGYLIITIEETDLLIAKNKVKEFENYFSLISEFAKIGYAKINLQGNEDFGVRQWFKNFNENDKISVKEVINSFHTLYHEDKMALSHFIEEAKKGKADHLSKVMRVKGQEGQIDEKWIFLGILLSDYEPNKDITELVSVNYDITEFKKTEQELIFAKDKAEEMDRLKSAFLANMSHEIRTPLNAIVGFSDLLVNSKDSSERQLFFEILEKNNNLLLKLINDILDLSKIEAGTMIFKYTDVDVNRICNDIAIAMRLKVSGNVKIIFSPTIPECHITTDSERLNQLISNLVNNAIKFTDKGNITIAYELVDLKHIKFTVTDTGIGIEEKNRKHIFERFIKLNSFAPGTGLGLSICRSIVEQMSGKIGVESEVGKGSCFWFIVPRHQHAFIKR